MSARIVDLDWERRSREDASPKGKLEARVHRLEDELTALRRSMGGGQRSSGHPESRDDSLDPEIDLRSRIETARDVLAGLAGYDGPGAWVGPPAGAKPRGRPTAAVSADQFLLDYPDTAFAWSIRHDPGYIDLYWRVAVARDLFRRWAADNRRSDKLRIARDEIDMQIFLEVDAWNNNDGGSVGDAILAATSAAEWYEHELRQAGLEQELRDAHVRHRAERRVAEVAIEETARAETESLQGALKKDARGKEWGLSKQDQRRVLTFAQGLIPDRKLGGKPRIRLERRIAKRMKTEAVPHPEGRKWDGGAVCDLCPDIPYGERQAVEDGIGHVLSPDGTTGHGYGGGLIPRARVYLGCVHDEASAKVERDERQGTPAEIVHGEIRRQPGIAGKHALAMAVHMSQTVVSKLVAELIAQGLVVRVPYGGAKGGQAQKLFDRSVDVLETELARLGDGDTKAHTTLREHVAQLRASREDR
jgi:hypothetical protein